MDAPWRALPTRPPETQEEADKLNQVLKDYLYNVEKLIIKDFKTKVYARAHSDWFEVFLVTFIFQIVLSENLEMSFYAQVEDYVSVLLALGFPQKLTSVVKDKPLEMPWSTFGGLRNYSSKAIGAYFDAINGAAPFQMKSAEVAELGQLGLIEAQYLEDCSKLMKGHPCYLSYLGIGAKANENRFADKKG